MKGHLTPAERAELREIEAQRITGMEPSTWRRYVELRRKERGDSE